MDPGTYDIRLTLIGPAGRTRIDRIDLFKPDGRKMKTAALRRLP